jgi:hypothetical protein
MIRGSVFGNKESDPLKLGQRSPTRHLGRFSV